MPVGLFLTSLMGPMTKSRLIQAGVVPKLVELLLSVPFYNSLISCPLHTFVDK
jgi:hypothetical protein